MTFNIDIKDTFKIICYVIGTIVITTIAFQYFLPFVINNTGNALAKEVSNEFLNLLENNKFINSKMAYLVVMGIAGITDIILNSTSEEKGIGILIKLINIAVFILFIGCICSIFIFAILL